MENGLTATTPSPPPTVFMAPEHDNHKYLKPTEFVPSPPNMPHG